MAQTRQQPEQQAPPVQRLRLRYCKRGRARFTSHRDFSRAFERALRRAAVPMAYSSGFNPHPRVSFANASPTGAATEAEYLEIGLAERCDPDAVRAALTDALPDGMEILEAVEGSGPSLVELLTASEWEIALAGVGQDVLERAVTALLAADSAPVSRMTKTGVREFDARPAIVRLEVAGPGRLRLVSLHQAPLVRPDDVVAALVRLEPDSSSPSPALLTRLDQGHWDGQRIVRPFEG